MRIPIHCFVIITCLRISFSNGATTRLAFAAGFGANPPKKATKKRKRTIIGDDDLVEMKPPAAVALKDEPNLDRFGLPPPTIDDIFGPMPPGTEIISATKESYSLSAIKDAMKRHIPLKYENFDDNGVERNPSIGCEPMKLKLLHISPPVLAIENYFTPEECLQVLDISNISSNSSQNKSAVRVESATFTHSISTRMSTSWFCYYSQVPTLLAKAKHRLLDIVLSQLEEPQIVRYKTGQEFSWHYDEIPSQLLENGGQRVATLLVYLNTVERGGATIFRDLRDVHGTMLSMKPKQGTALLFFPAFADGHPDDRTLHKGELAEDEKHIVQVWIREREYRAVLPFNNRHEDALEGVTSVTTKLGYL
jgi:prolyl 4-hydroxylase